MKYLEPYLIGFLQDVDELVDLWSIWLGEECVRGALVVRSSGSSDSVHVVFNVWWEIVVDNKLHVIDIYFD